MYSTKEQPQAKTWGCFILVIMKKIMTNLVFVYANLLTVRKRNLH